MHIDPQDLETPKSKWLDCGGVRFLIKYVPPIQLERWRKRMVQQGIMRETRGGGIDCASGREADFYRSIAETFVENWEGNITGNPSYSVELMGKILAFRDDVWKAVREAIAEQADFFVGNGSTPTTS